MRYDFFVVVGDTEVTGYQEDNFSHRDHTGEPVYGEEETIITEAIDQAPPEGCSDKLDVDALMADKEFMSSLEGAIADGQCDAYEARFGI
jgi:hypothetical protein